MIYRRTLDRALPGGSDSFVVTRDFAVTFQARGDQGFEIVGKQVGASVSVPENIAHLGELERQRVEHGIFPLYLDASGHIIDGDDPYPSAMIDAALADAQRRFADRGDEVGLLLDALHSAGEHMIAELPRDLFAPSEDMRENRNEVTLPWGDRGEVMTRFEARRDPETRLMRTAHREVRTLLAGEERRSAEAWELFPAQD
ncbi:hypothetical protein [Alteraurantiacibacter aquimixticola]|uniref:Uncharacterized protein n=1 Tax=Alteraurantiacibacter aquimixticola TaxID=2489173 RepID=A0A4T3EZ26_9SPHN|nr:hypothetical protein [Alteraurantiacibacter aquimixticola]TIX49119.1 hypothetical protein E5222_15465 [Alteraurantiacibacter aquimixticola]